MTGQTERVDLTQDVLQVAPALLGARLRVGAVNLRLTEVEAYSGLDDPAAHAFRGWRPHTRHLFEPPGTLYCYRSYGIHICANVVCGPEGSGSAVLIRAGEVVDGLDLARSRRPRSAGRPAGPRSGLRRTGAGAEPGGFGAPDRRAGAGVVPFGGSDGGGPQRPPGWGLGGGAASLAFLAGGGAVGVGLPSQPSAAAAGGGSRR